MPEVGGKSIAAEFSLGIAGIKKVADALKLKAAGAVTEFMAEAKNLDKAADRVISEASEMRRAAAEILGNEVETTSDRPQVNGADQTKTT